MFVDSNVREKKKKANILSKILRIDQPVQSKNSSSSPDIELIKKLKEKLDIDNPLLMLSIEDYTQMCKNKILFNMMVKVLDTNKKKLAKICKNINILKDNINSSPESIKNKMNMKKMSILDLPDDMRKKIVEICANEYKYVLHDWIPSHYIIMKSLSANYNAIDFLSLPENQKHINYSKLSKNTNPEAIKLIKERLLIEKDIPYEMLQKEENKIDWDELLENSVAINGLEEEFEEYFMNDKKKDLLNLLNNENSKAIIILKKLLKSGKYINDDIDWDCISGNTSPEAFKLLKKNIHKISWKYLSTNTHPKAIKLLEKEIEKQMEWNFVELDYYAELDDGKKIDWDFISSNPKAIHILIKKWKNERRLMRFDIERYNKLKNLNMIISWEYVSDNPEAIKLIKKKIKLEDKLSEYRYYNLSKSEKISWSVLSSNPNAIDILSLPENEDWINWDMLAENPNAIKLIKKKIKEEESLSSSNNSSSAKSSSCTSDGLFYDDPSFLESSTESPLSYDFLSESNQLSETPSKDTINPYLLSENPSIFILK
jgi:hypothetical protein